MSSHLPVIRVQLRGVLGAVVQRFTTINSDRRFSVQFLNKKKQIMSKSSTAACRQLNSLAEQCMSFILNTENPNKNQIIKIDFI